MTTDLDALLSRLTRSDAIGVWDALSPAEVDALPIVPSGAWAAVLRRISGLELTSAAPRPLPLPFDSIGFAWVDHHNYFADALFDGPAFLLATDGAGNDWIAEVDSKQRDVTGVYFLCHDPPKLQFVAPNLVDLLTQIAGALDQPNALTQCYERGTPARRAEDGLVFDLRAPGSSVSYAELDVDAGFERSGPERIWSARASEPRGIRALWKRFRGKQQ